MQMAELNNAKQLFKNIKREKLSDKFDFQTDLF